MVRMISLYHLASGDGEIRTLDPLLARQVLSQLSYAPILLVSCSGLTTDASYQLVPYLYKRIIFY